MFKFAGSPTFEEMTKEMRDRYNCFSYNHFTKRAHFRMRDFSGSYKLIQDFFEIPGVVIPNFSKYLNATTPCLIRNKKRVDIGFLYYSDHSTNSVYQGEKITIGFYNGDPSDNNVPDNFTFYYNRLYDRSEIAQITGAPIKIVKLFLPNEYATTLNPQNKKYYFSDAQVDKLMADDRFQTRCHEEDLRTNRVPIEFPDLLSPKDQKGIFAIEDKSISLGDQIGS